MSQRLPGHLKRIEANSGQFAPLGTDFPVHIGTFQRVWQQIGTSDWDVLIHCHNTLFSKVSQRLN